MINKRFLPWFILAIGLVITVGITAYSSLKKQTGQSSTVLTVSIGTIFILFIVAALIRLVMKEYRNRVQVEQALNDKLRELNLMNEETKAANWLLDGIRLINDSLMGNDTLEALVQSTLDAMTAYLQLPCAVCYTYDKDKQELIVAGSVAVDGNNHPKLKLGEGLAGAAAKRKNLTIVDDVPVDYWKINSGSGMAVPDTLIFLPLWKKNELVGLIEFGGFGSKLNRVTALLRDMGVNIALGISAAQLLGVTQSQRDVLEAQQEELRQSNDELNVQTEELRATGEILKSKEEELTIINQTLEEKTESLEMAGVEMQRKNDDLERSGKYKSEFLANMSHELRTPLNSILILTALMQENKDKNLTNRQQDNLRIVYQSGSDLLNLINDVLDLSKIEAGKVNFNIEELAIKDLAEDIQRSFDAVAGKKHISFNVDTAKANGIIIQTDRQRLGQVIKNLLSNAFKFTPDGGIVNLNFVVAHASLNIIVTDTGIGIAPEKQQLIFEAFQQADGATTRRYGGTGLGLSISKELVSKLGGQISVHSTAGQGSTFTVTMPLNGTVAPNDYEAPVDEPTIKEQTQIRDDRPALLPSQRSVLIIEDDVNFARIVNDFATERGFKTIIALSGDEGLYYARKYRPSAIILDLSLPVLSGQHILRTIKSDPQLQHIPVHVISAMDGLDLPARDIEGFVQKPIGRQELGFTFGSIETYIKQHYRKVLILSRADSQLRSFLAESRFAGTIYDITDSFEQALNVLKAGDADCLIYDTGTDEELALQQLQQLRAEAAGVHIIACSETQLSPATSKKLQPFTNALIGPSAQTGKRLLDEVELFLHRMTEKSTVQVPEQFNADNDVALTGKTILIADDDMRNIYALSVLLETHGMKVVTAEHGKEAIDLLAKNKTDLVLMDIMMPEMDGYEAMRIIRENPAYARLPVIALTAKAMLGDREKCLAAGASDYITKPVNNQQLLSLLRVWLAAK